MQATPVVDTSLERRENRAKAIAELRGQMLVALALCVLALAAIALSVDAAGITTAIVLQWSRLCAAVTLDNARPLLGKAFLLAGAFTVLSLLTVALSFAPVMRRLRSVSAALACGAVGLIWFSFILFEILCIFVARHVEFHTLALTIVLCGLVWCLCTARESGQSVRDIFAYVAPVSLLVFGVIALCECFATDPAPSFMPRGASWLGVLMFGLFCVRETTLETLNSYAQVERRIDDVEAGRVTVRRIDDTPVSEAGEGEAVEITSPVDQEGAPAPSVTEAPPKDSRAS